jgi:GNAT superfamily N-acetyltransferase
LPSSPEGAAAPELPLGLPSSGNLARVVGLPGGARAQAPLIRRGRSDEAHELAELHLRSALSGFAHIFPSDAPVPDLSELIEQWIEMVRPDAAETNACFVAVSTDRIVGTVIARPAPGDAACGQLSRLYVDPTEWGRGIGRLLYDAAIRHLRKSGFRTAILSVLEGNHRARSWYERLGWQPTTARIPVYQPAGIEDIVYTITL